ncbi:MAG: hypothetical protein WCP28_12150, partial [Actinomycetes bacterium]
MPLRPGPCQSLALIGALLVSIGGAGLAGCSATSDSAGDPIEAATLVISQDRIKDPGSDPRVYNPFYATGSGNPCVSAPEKPPKTFEIGREGGFSGAKAWMGWTPATLTRHHPPAPTPQ